MLFPIIMYPWELICSNPLDDLDDLEIIVKLVPDFTLVFASGSELRWNVHFLLDAILRRRTERHRHDLFRKWLELRVEVSKAQLRVVC